MQPLIEDMLKSVDEVLRLLKKNRLEVLENINIGDNERQGRIWVLDMIGDFCSRVRLELVAKKWPKRPVRAMRLTALFRAIEDMGWNPCFDDSEANQAFSLFEKVKKSYRRLPEAWEDFSGEER